MNTTGNDINFSQSKEDRETDKHKDSVTDGATTTKLNEIYDKVEYLQRAVHNLTKIVANSNMRLELSVKEQARRTKLLHDYRT
jgi:hypothetical protein